MVCVYFIFNEHIVIMNPYLSRDFQVIVQYSVFNLFSAASNFEMFDLNRMFMKTDNCYR